MINYLKNKLFPNIYCKNIANINFQYLNSIGIRYIIFDKDNTLTNHNEHIINNEIYNTFKNIYDNSKIETIIVSNNKIKNNIKIDINTEIPLKKTLSKKPFNYDEIIPSNINPSSVCVIGDRLLTDILLAKNNNCLSILVQPFSTEKEELGIKIMRSLENVIIKRFKLNSIIKDFNKLDESKLFINN